MGGRGGASAMVKKITAAAARAQNDAVFPDTDPNGSGFHDGFIGGGRAYYKSQSFSADQRLSIIEYLKDQPEKGSLYSISQNLNHALTDAADNGTAPVLNANQTYMYQHLTAAMHNLGQNVNLIHYDHAGTIEKMLNTYYGTTMPYTSHSVTDLNNALTGNTLTLNKFVSTTYNDFKYAGPQAQRTFQDRAIRFEIKARSNAQVIMPGNGPGGQLGEVVMHPDTQFKITGVRYDNSRTIRQKGTAYKGSTHQLVIEVETI